MADRRVKVIFSAEIQNFKSAMDAAAQATQKSKTASEAAGKAADKSAEEIQKQALAHHAAAKAVGLQYDNTGQLVTMNGKAVSSQQAATHGLQTFSAEAYLAGRAAVTAGEDAETAAKVAAEAEAEAAAAIEKRREAMERVGAIAMTVGAATLAGVGLAVKAYADFDKQMSSVDAATHETAGNMQLLRDAAVDAGADTAFSAVEAAKGIEEMAKAGVSTKDILGGGLTGALSLAAAGSLDVGAAAEIASSAMTQFKLSGDKIPHVADLLAAGAGKAQGSVEDLGMALNQSGLIASQTGLTIEETTGGLAAFASAGLTGSDAGTSFKSMLQALTPNSAKAATAMSELGISAYDSQGNFVGLSEFAGQLKGSLSGLTAEQRNTTLETIFGSDAVRAAAVLYEQGSEGVEKWENAVNDAGYAAETAARMQDNLAGDLEKLGGAFDTALIQSGSGANEVLRGLVQGLEGMVDAVGRIPTPILNAGLGFTALLGGAALLGGGLITVIPKIRDTKDALEVLAPAGSKANTALSRTGKIAAGAAVGLAAVGAAAMIAGPALDDILKPTGETGEALEAFAGQAAQGAVGADTLNKSFQDLVQGQEGVGAFQTAIEGVADPGLWGNIDNIVVGGIKVLSLGMADVTSTSEKARERFRALGEQLATLDAKKAAESFQDMAGATDGSQDKLKQLLDLMPAYRKTLEEQAKATGQATDDQTLLDIAMGKLPASTDAAKTAIEAEGDAAEKAAAQTEEIQKALEDVGISAQGTVVDLEKFAAALFAAGLTTMSAREATAAHQAAIDGTKSAVEAATKAIEDQLIAEGHSSEAAKVLAAEQYKLGGALNKSKTDFDLTTEAGRLLNAQFQTVASTGMAEIEAKAKAGAGQPELQENLSTTYQSLLTAAAGMGITGGEAETLARKVLGVPDGVSIDSWMSDQAKVMAEQTTGALDKIDGRVVRTKIETLIETINKQVHTSEYRDDPSMVALDPSRRATGGRVPGYTDGGKLPSTGPGTHITDGFLGVDAFGMPRVRVDAREWIINGDSSDHYNRELAAINAGTFPKLPGYANGARAGREYSAQSLGCAPFRAAPAMAGGVTFGNVTISDQSDPVATFHELSRRARSLAS
jgi:TP901 family phage tail tape measure protein